MVTLAKELNTRLPPVASFIIRLHRVDTSVH